MRHLLVSFMFVTALCWNVSKLYAQSTAPDTMAVEEDVADTEDTALPETAPQAPIDENTKLVLAQADLYVDQASRSFAKGEVDKAERALKKASAVMTDGLETVGMDYARMVLASSKALFHFGGKVANGEVKTAEEFEATLDKDYRKFFVEKKSA